MGRAPDLCHVCRTTFAGNCEIYPAPMVSDRTLVRIIVQCTHLVLAAIAREGRRTRAMLRETR